MSAVWPASLPLSPAMASYGESLMLNTVRTPGDNGPAASRYRGRMASVLSYEQVLRDDQVETLRAFMEDTLLGVRRFTYRHPRTGATVEARMVADRSGSYSTLTPICPGLWKASLQLEILP